MLKWHDGRKPIKKLPRWVWAILVLLLFYSMLYVNIPAEANSEQIFIEHVVEPGETLWSIVTVLAADLHCGQAMAETLEWKAGQSGE